MVVIVVMDGPLFLVVRLQRSLYGTELPCEAKSTSSPTDQLMGLPGLNLWSAARKVGTTLPTVFLSVGAHELIE
jgi:hypothetical protein